MTYLSDMILRLKWQLYLPTRLKWQLSQNTKRQISGGDPLVAGPCALPERCPALPRGERGRLGQRCTAGHRGDGQARGRAIRKTFRSFSGLKRRTWFVGGDTIRIYKGNIGPIGGFIWIFWGRVHPSFGLQCGM